MGTLSKSKRRVQAAPARTPSRSRTLRLLVTGFGPFPGAPENPTGPLVRALARKWQSTPGVSVKAHVFQTRYRTVDRALPRLLKMQRPHALIMFGVAGNSRAIRVETLARNRISHHPDAGGYTRGPCPIEADAPNGLDVRAPTAALLQAIKRTGLSARLSRNAGDYLCNYVLWHGTLAARATGGPQLCTFIHVPPLSRRITPDALIRAGDAVIRAVVTSLRRRGNRIGGQHHE